MKDVKFLWGNTESPDECFVFYIGSFLVTVMVYSRQWWWVYNI